MVSAPFALFAQFNNIQINLLIKEDDAGSDGDIAAVLKTDRVASLHQVHGNETIFVRKPTSRTLQADGMVTDQPGITLTTRSADCQSFVIFASEKNVIGVLHAGWKGLIAGAIPQHFAMLKKEWGIEPTEAFVGIGPSLRQCCAEFSDPLNELPGIDPCFVDAHNHVDLAGIADAQLDELGVPPEQRERLPDCTCCHPEAYWTYRGGDREDVVAGRTNVLGVTLG